MKWIYNDCSYSKYYKDNNNNSNSIIRSIALAENKDYKEIDELISKYIEKEHLDNLYVSNARTGVSKEVAYELLNDLGYKWISKMKFGLKNNRLYIGYWWLSSWRVARTTLRRYRF